ncbi:MAG: glycosyltransferase [Gemmatimonadales bacterium]|nr:MAG: glycosyltransferase [Gemmatimonadales bacterium]
MRQCDVLTGVSRTQCEYYRRRYGVPMAYIPAGADAKEKVRPHEIRRLGLGSDPYVLYVGRLSPEKGVHTLVSAFGRMGGRRRLVLAGPVCDRRYGQRLKDLAGGDDRILFAGAVKGRMLGELFSNAAVYVQPSQLEGLSMALLEAMSYGCCCLVSDIPENLEAIGHAGRSFACDDAEGLRERLACLLDDPDEAHALGTKARRRVIECYDWEKITSQFEDLYRGLPTSRAA